MHLFVDKLTNVDFSYLHPERGLVGETWLASVVLEGGLDSQGMICDFGIVKKTLRHWLDQNIDHSLLVASESSQLNIEQTNGSLSLDWTYGQEPNFTLLYSSPDEAVTLIDSDEVTTKSVAKWCVEQLRKLLPDTIDRIQLSFEPEIITHHFYHYSHGLKKHEGNCQRIAHGHRSTIEIMRNDQRDFELEAQWCESWRDVYIGSREDVKDKFCLDGIDYYVFSYRSQQGYFELTIPLSTCYLIDTESTVECIAQHMADSLKHQQPQDHFTVKAYEGVGKGAIAFS